MKWLILVNAGIEHVTAQELGLFGVKKITPFSGGLVIETKVEDVVRIAYSGQTINRILLYISDFTFSDLQDFEKKLKNIDIKELSSSQTFAARSEHIDTDISSSEIQPLVGEIVGKKTKARVNLSNPDVVLFTFISKNKAYVGIDVTGDLSKRDYRIYTLRDQLKAPVAYAALLFSGWKPEHSLLAAYCNTGLVPIEAALSATRMSPHYYKKDKFLFYKLNLFKDSKNIIEDDDKKIQKNPGKTYAVDETMRSVDAAKKNAKIGGVHKAIAFSRKEVSWWDTKFGEHSIDRVVCWIPQPSKILSEQKVAKIYHEFFYQCAFVLKKDGKIGVITKHPDLLLADAKRHTFKEEKRLEVTQGQDKLFFVLFSP